MDLDSYLGKVCKIELSNGFYFLGKITSIDEDSIDLIDKNNQNVTLSKNSILVIREVNQNDDS